MQRCGSGGDDCPVSGEASVAGENVDNESRVAAAGHSGKGFNGFSGYPQEGCARACLLCRELPASGKGRSRDTDSL